MTEYRKFYLVPEQQAPKGSTSRAMPDGGIVWIGDKWTATKIKSHVMSDDELTEYKLLLQYEKEETIFEISFEDYKDNTKLAACKVDIVSKINTVSNTVKEV